MNNTEVTVAVFIDLSKRKQQTFANNVMSDTADITFGSAPRIGPWSTSVFNICE